MLLEQRSSQKKKKRRRVVFVFSVLAVYMSPIAFGKGAVFAGRPKLLALAGSSGCRSKSSCQWAVEQRSCAVLGPVKPLQALLALP